MQRYSISDLFEAQIDCYTLDWYGNRIHGLGCCRCAIIRLCGLFIEFILKQHAGASKLLEGAQTDPKLVIGIIFILAGQLANAIQMVIEESFLRKRDYPALHVVGMEGIHGVLFMVLIILPIMYLIPGKLTLKALLFGLCLICYHSLICR